MGTMMALRAHARGGPEQLVYEQAPAPSAGPGEALIAVHAAAITSRGWSPSSPRAARRSSRPSRLAPPRASRGRDPKTVAFGLTVPKPLGDFRPYVADSRH